MNILILSCGSRVKLVEYFKKEFNKGGAKVVVTDCSTYAPALYVADNYYLVPKINNSGYIDKILEICKKEKINGVFSLIDPELSLISKNKNKFKKLGVKIIGSDYELNELCFNKYEFYKKMKQIKIPTVKSYIDMKELNLDLKKGEISYPVFIKPVNGSASINIGLISNETELLDKISNHKNQFIIQEYIKGKEYGADVFVDMISGKVTELFIKEKLKMRAGETDKSITINDLKLKQLILNFSEKMGFLGQLDIDIFEKNGEFIISEVNPRFGGGYLHAQESGMNSPKLIMNNLRGKENKIDINKEYSETIMMKYSEVQIIGVD